MNASNSQVAKTYQEISQIDQFYDQINESDKPVLVDFYADWCGPCQALEPVIAQVSSELKDEVSIIKVNVDAHAEIARQFAITSIPTLVLFSQGEPVGRLKGFVPKGTLLDFIRAHQ